MECYRIRPDREGHTVYDAFTGEPVVIAHVPQTGLTDRDARETAALLNRCAGWDPKLLQ